MLKYETIYPGTLELLKSLMVFPALKDFYLVGGTALALHLGHRMSVDLDLFSNSEFDTKEMIEQLENEIPVDKTLGEAKNSLNLVINNSGVSL